MLALGLLLAAPAVFMGAVGMGMAAGDSMWMKWCDGPCQVRMHQQMVYARWLSYATPFLLVASIGAVVWARVVQVKLKKTLR
ncbi:hypothetical protein SAMN05421770_102564 [Granulicella rosea]|uniref:Uncharacterized protein n=2 Tax=Granulicella rosea TaxID=474952 RepID=A0A239HU79_9BACT|nr:hypothetical protein SAMN05421770_102564 [Granulicella rosea]